MRLGKVRPVAICIFCKHNAILVAEGYDPTRQLTFYRPLGGAIEFGEYSHTTIVRELREELGAEVKNLRYLGTLENVFTYDGQMGHEIVLVYEGEFVDQSLYEQEIVEGREDDDTPIKAVWKVLASFQHSQTPLFPEGLRELLAQ